MADIQEIPLDGVDIMENIVEEIVESEQPEPETKEPEAKEPVKAKAKGRPKGALNKGPSKPRAKKTQIQETPVEHGQDSPPAYEPSSPKRNLKLPMDPSTSDVAAAMLKLLQDQSYSRQSRKQRLYNSWFQ